MANITAADVSKLRQITGAGMMDCKKALVEAEGDFEKAKDLIRERGLAIANKRSDRKATEGAVLAKTVNNNTVGVVIALNCETDFVAKNQDFISLAQKILDIAGNELPENLDGLKAIKINSQTIEEMVTERSGITGEKMELAFYGKISATYVSAYIHMGNKLATIVGFNQIVPEELGINVAMQVTAMNPIALNEAAVSQSVIDSEMAVYIEKTKLELVSKDVENALRQAGINPSLVDSDDHIHSNIAKGWLTEEEGNKAKEIKDTVSAKASASLPQAKIDNIAKGRLQKFFKENTLLNQEFVQFGKTSVADYLKQQSANLTVTDYKRFGLNN